MTVRQEPGTYSNLLIEAPGESWIDGSAYNQPHTCDIGNDGTVTNLDVLSRVQHGVVNHLNWHNPVTFNVNYPTAGPHTIVVENTGANWFYVSYRLTNYLTGPNLRVLALSNPTSALVWVQNKDHTWWDHRSGMSPQPVNPSEITLSGFQPGTYCIEQWDTYAGAATRITTYTSSDGAVVITTPAALTTDLAYKIRKQ